MLNKKTVIDTLERLKGGTKGVVAETISDCQRVISAMDDDSGWIPVTERMPQEDVRVITLDKHGNVGIRALKRFVGEKNHLFRPDGLAPGKYITHWMPLPEIPKEDNDG